MPLSARRRPGTSPSFWRSYHNAQFKVAASSMRVSASGIVREPGIHKAIADYEKAAKPPASHFVNVGRS
jgi:hypothetical protein